MGLLSPSDPGDNIHLNLISEIWGGSFIVVNQQLILEEHRGIKMVVD